MNYKLASYIIFIISSAIYFYLWTLIRQFDGWLYLANIVMVMAISIVFCNGLWGYFYTNKTKQTLNKLELLLEKLQELRVVINDTKN